MNINDFIQNNVKPLPIFLLLDCSGSMMGYKIDTLNRCVHEMINDFRSERMSEVNIKLCVISFGGQTAKLHMDLEDLSKLNYSDLHADGMTPLGSALRMASNIINDKEKVTSHGYKPVVVLVSDGYPNDDWERPLDDFINNGRTKKCERWALGIGEDADEQMLKQFINSDERPVFDASQAKEISQFFKFVTMSTIARTKSQNPNLSVNFSEIAADMNEELKDFDFDLND